MDHNEEIDFDAKHQMAGVRQICPFWYMDKTELPVTQHPYPALQHLII